MLFTCIHVQLHRLYTVIFHSHVAMLYEVLPYSGKNSQFHWKRSISQYKFRGLCHDGHFAFVFRHFAFWWNNNLYAYAAANQQGACRNVSCVSLALIDHLRWEEITCQGTCQYSGDLTFIINSCNGNTCAAFLLHGP